MKTPPSLQVRAVAEFFGTAWLLIAIVGSGIMAERLSPADAGLQLLQNALVTGFALAAIIAALRPVSGAHVNPAVTLTAAAVGQLPWRDAASYLPSQIAGGIVGTLLANLMFGLPIAEVSSTVRDAPITWLGDLVATVGLLSLIFTLVATRSFGFCPAPSAPTWPAPTTSPHPPAWPTPPSPSAASSPTPSPASPLNPPPSSSSSN